MTRAPRTRRPVQGGLWGRSEPLPDAGRTFRYTTTNDVELVVMVIRSALEPGYVVVGAARRVYLRDGTRSGCVEPVPRYEADTVAQLLDQGHLYLGGTHHVSDGHCEGPARAVLVTASARAMADRWAVRPLPRTRPRNGR
jgi:hypothetical protein